MKLKNTPPEIIYYADSTVLVPLGNIYTRAQLLYRGQRLALVVDNEVTIVEIEDVYEEDGYVYIKTKGLLKGNHILLAHALDGNVDYGWALVSVEYIFDFITDEVVNKVKKWGELEYKQ